MPDSSPAQLGLLFFRSCCLFGQNGGGTGAELTCVSCCDYEHRHNVRDQFAPAASTNLQALHRQ